MRLSEHRGRDTTSCPQFQLNLRHAIAVAMLPLLLLAADAAWPLSKDAGCNLALSLYFSIAQKIQACELVIHAPIAGAPPEARAFGYYNRGLLYHMLGKYDLAIADYTSAMGWKRNFEDALEARGDAYADAGERDKASADYAQAAALKADGPAALAGRCWARGVRGHPLDRALDDCNAALTNGADETETRLLRCFVDYRLARYADAVSDCGKAEASRARFAAALYIGGVAKLRSGDVAGGNADITAALDADHSIAVVWGLYGVRR
ncbi:MAG TPA: tetratricopeptide repeat protein [Rhizomicrobium sp.]|nr:tetratricopeptide repeat protein [Rhizomicrobium sp.]